MSQIVAVQIPVGVPPGAQFMALMPSGQPMMVVNPGLPAGSIVHVRAPMQMAPQPQQMMMGTPPPVEKAPTVQALKEDEIPKDAEVVTATVPAFKKTTQAEAPKNEDLCPCAALCCITYSLWPVFPDCLGVYCKGVACACIQVEQVCCKISKSEGSLFKCCNGELEIIEPQGFCKLASTVCCVDARIALPTDSEVPCQLACLGFICMKAMQCECKFHETGKVGSSASV
jgi:hypothetical protein